MSSRMEQTKEVLGKSFAVLPAGSVAWTAGTVACCAGGAVFVQACLGPVATGVINSGVLGFGGGKQREVEPSSAGTRPSQSRRGRRHRPEPWLTATASELRANPDRRCVRFGVDSVGLNSLACVLPDVAKVGAATALACSVGGCAAGAAAVVGVICASGLSTGIAVDGVELGDSNGLIAACAPELPVEATSVCVGRIELRLSWRMQLGVRMENVSVVLGPYDLGSKAQHYARLRRRIERRAANAHKVRHRQDDLEEERRFIARQRNAWWLAQSPRAGIYKVVTSWWHPRGVRVRRVGRGESVVLGWLGVRGRHLLRVGGVAIAAAAIAGSCMRSLVGGDAKACRETARTSAKAIGTTGMIAVFFADWIAAAVLDRVHVEVNNIDLSFTDREHTARISCEKVRWERLVNPTTLTARSFWQRWVWSTYGTLPSLHCLRTSPVVLSVAARDNPADASLRVAPLVAEVSVVAECASARTDVEIGLPAISMASNGHHVLAARWLRGLRSELMRGSKIMQFGLQRLWAPPQETPLRRWQHAICSVLMDCQRRAGMCTVGMVLKTRGLRYRQRRAARLWSYAFRCVRIELLRAQYGRNKLSNTSVSEPTPRGPGVSKTSTRSHELEECDLDDLQEQALAAGVEQSQLELAEASSHPRDATISLLLGAEQACTTLRCDRRWSVQIDAAEARFVDTSDHGEVTTVKISAKSLRAVHTNREAIGTALPLVAVNGAVGKLTCNFNSSRVLQTTAHVLTARSANCLEVTMNSSYDLRARIGVLKLSLTPELLQSVVAVYIGLNMSDSEYVPTLVRKGAFDTKNIFSYSLGPFMDEQQDPGIGRETRRLRHRHRPQVDIKANLPIISFGSDDAKQMFELGLGTVNVGNTSADLRSLLTSAARLDDTRYNAVGCRWEGACATFTSKSGGRQQVFKEFGGTACIQACALSTDYMWAQRCPQLLSSVNFRALEAQATRSAAVGLMELMLVMYRALSENGSLDGANGDLVEMTPPGLGLFARSARLARSPDPVRWCFRHVTVEPREWAFSILDDCSLCPVLKFAFDVDDLRLRHFNTGHCNLYLQLKMHAYAYNASVVAWEPVIEPWVARLTSLQLKDKTCVKFDGDQLNVNLCPSLVRSLGTGQVPSGSASRHTQTWLVNCTGTAIIYRIACSFDAHGQVLAHDVRNNQESRQLEDGAKGLLNLVVPAEPGVAFDQGLQIEFPDVLWHDTEFTDVSREAVQSKLIGGSMAGITVVCVTEVQRDGTRLITLCSGVKVDNQTNRDLEFGLQRCDVAGVMDEHVRSAMVVPRESSGFFSAALWSTELHDKRSSQLVVFRTCDAENMWTDPYDLRQPVSAKSAKLVVCNGGTESQFTCCLSVTPGYAPAGKLSVLTLFNCLDVQNDFTFPIELQFFEEKIPKVQPTVPCTAGNPFLRLHRSATVESGERVSVPGWDPKKDAWMAVSNCEGAISSRVCVYRAHDSGDQSLASDVVLRGGRFAFSGIYTAESSKLSTESGMEYASCLPLSLHYVAQGVTIATEGDASHLVKLSCSFLICNKTPLPLILRSRHAKRTDQDVVVSLPAHDLNAAEQPTPCPFTSHGNIEVGKRVDVLDGPEADADHADSMILSIICAKALKGGLVDRLTLDVPDPYVKVMFSPRLCTDDSTTDNPRYVMGDPVYIGRTTALQDSAYPVWNERFFVRVPVSGGTIKLKVMDFDRWTGDDSIGEAKIDIEHGTTIEQTSVDVLGLGGIRKGQLEIRLEKPADCMVPLVGLVVDAWGSRVLSTAHAGPQVLPVSLGRDDIGVTVAPVNRSPGAPHVVTIVPRYRVDNLSHHTVTVASGKRDGHTMQVVAGQSDHVVGLSSGADPMLFFKAKQLEGDWSAWSRGVMAGDGRSDLAIDSTRIICGDINLDVRYEVCDGTGVFIVRAGTPAVVVENLAFDQIWISKDVATKSRHDKVKNRINYSSGPRSRMPREKPTWILLSKTEKFCFHEWDWHTEGNITLKTWNDQTCSVDVSTLTDPTADGWSWTTATGETVWPQVIMVNNVRLLRLGKTAVRPRSPRIENVLKLNASVPGVGLSVIGDPKHGDGSELLYASFRSVALHHVMKDSRLTADFSIGTFQVDEYVSNSDRPGQRDMIAGPRLLEKQSSQSAMLHIRTVRVYQPGPALYESVVAKTRPIFFNLKWSTVSRLLSERSVQQLCHAFMCAKLTDTSRSHTSAHSLLQAVQVDPVTVDIHFDMMGCASESNLLKVLALDKYVQQLESAGKQDTGAIRSQQLNLRDIYYAPQQVLLDVATEVLDQITTRIMLSSSAAVSGLNSALAVHQKSGYNRSTRSGALNGFAIEDALVLATEPPLVKMMEMVSKVTDTAPGRQHRNGQVTRNMRSDGQLFAQRWPRVFGLNGVLKVYSVNDVILCKLLQKSGCSEGCKLDEDCLEIVAVAEPANPTSRSLMLLTKHMIFFAKPVPPTQSIARHRPGFHDIGTLEAVFTDEIAVRDIREVAVNLSEGTLFLRMSASERTFTTHVGPMDAPLETDFKLTEFFNHLVGLLENMRVVAAQQRRFGDSLLPRRLSNRRADTTRDRHRGQGIAAPGTLSLMIIDASWENLCTHGQRYSSCRTCKRLRVKPSKPSSDDWFCEVQVGSRRPRRLVVGKEVKFDLGGGPRCVVALKNATAVGAKCVGTAELRVDGSSVGPTPEEQWWSLSPLPGSTQVPGAKVKLRMSHLPRVDDTLNHSGPMDMTFSPKMFDTCTVLHVDITSIRLPMNAHVVYHGEKLACALKLVCNGLAVEEKDAFVIVSATEQRCEARGMEPVLFDLTEMSGMGDENAFLHAQLLLDDGYTVVCEEKFLFPGPQIGWSRQDDPTLPDEQDDSSARVTRHGDIDVSMKVDAIQTSWSNIDLPLPQLVEYEVTLRTGEHRDAGTDASIFVQLIGDQGHSCRIPLHLSEAELRAGIVPGGTNVFRIAAPKVGKLQRLRIGHDNTGTASLGRSQAWFLQSAIVKRATPSVNGRTSSESDDDPVSDDDSANGVVFQCSEWFGRPLPAPTVGMTSAQARLKNPGFRGKPLVYTGDVALSRELLAPHVDPVCLLDTYHVTVSTGNVGTDGLVSLTLYGSDGDSGAHELRHRKGGKIDTKRRTFEAGAVETFVLESFALGTLRYIKLSLSAVDYTKPAMLPGLFAASKQGDTRSIAIEEQLATGWMCEHVTIRNLRTMVCWSLPIQCLLATKEGAGGMDGLSRTLALGSAQQMAVYRVTICTGDGVAAGTDAAVSLRMVGQNGQSNLLRLQRKFAHDEDAALPGDAGQIFQRGSTDEFELEIIDIGTVFQIELSHDGRGVGSGWFVDEVLVERLGAAVEAAKTAADAPTFGQPTGDWFSKSEGSLSRTHRDYYDIGGTHRRRNHTYRSKSKRSRVDVPPDYRAGSLAHPFTHHSLEADPSRGSSYNGNSDRAVNSGNQNSGSRHSKWGATSALEPMQTRFVVNAWVEDSPLVVEVDLNDPRILAVGRHSVRWLVTVKTGTMDFAATMSCVSLTLHGVSGEGGTHHLDKTTALYAPRKGPFARGAESVFSVRTSDLGSLTEVTVSHDNSAITTERAAWYLEWIEAIDEGTGIHYHFPCGQWLGGGRSRLESVKDFKERCGGIGNDGALFRTLTPLEPGAERFDPVRRLMETAEDTLGTLVVRRLRVLDPISPGAIRLALSKKRTYVRLRCGAANSRTQSTVSTTVHGSHKTLSNARASESWGNETIRLRVPNTAFGKGELKLEVFGKEKTFGIETTSLVMEGRDKPTSVGKTTIQLKDAFPEAFDDHLRFHSIGGMHHAVYELQSRDYSASAEPPLRVEILMMFLPNRARSDAKWLWKTREPQPRHSIQDLPEDYDWEGDLLLDSIGDEFESRALSDEDTIGIQHKRY